MWASDPYPGSMHDVAALDASGLLEGMDPSGWIGDKGYVGRGMITPHKKPTNGELSETAKEENKSVNRIRRAERAHHRPHQVLENPPHALQETPGNIRADHHRSTRTIFLQDHPLNNLPGCSGPPARTRGEAASVDNRRYPQGRRFRLGAVLRECSPSRGGSTPHRRSGRREPDRPARAPRRPRRRERGRTRRHRD